MRKSLFKNCILGALLGVLTSATFAVTYEQTFKFVKGLPGQTKYYKSAEITIRDPRTTNDQIVTPFGSNPEIVQRDENGDIVMMSGKTAVRDRNMATGIAYLPWDISYDKLKGQWIVTGYKVTRQIHKTHIVDATGIYSVEPGGWKPLQQNQPLPPRHYVEDQSQKQPSDAEDQSQQLPDSDNKHE
ncbi:MAG: hypothetical protein K0R14_115 [Burkholderiales bacterium]|jgi:hypothetical protein|nr:hypothetical protein [Burkholderiales bacterium]